MAKTIKDDAGERVRDQPEIVPRGPLHGTGGARLHPGRDALHITVITVLNKLVTKRLLVRKTQGGLLHYAAVMSREEFIAHAARRVVEGSSAVP